MRKEGKEKVLARGSKNWLCRGSKIIPAYCAEHLTSTVTLTVDTVSLRSVSKLRSIAGESSARAARMAGQWR